MDSNDIREREEPMSTTEVVQTVVLPGGRTFELGAPVPPVRREREFDRTSLLVVLPLVALLGAALALAGLSAVAPGPSHVRAPAAPVEQEEIEGDAGTYPLRLGPVYTR
jgi:hypothetical protein